MIRYELEQRAGYLYVGLDGEFDLPSAQSMYRAALQAAASRPEPRILLDSTRLRGTLTTEDRMQFGMFLAEEQARQAGRFRQMPQVAILAVAPIMDPGRFTQTVASNRGVKVRTSDSLQELLAWLGV